MDEKIQELIEQLKDPDEKIRDLAAWKLGCAALDGQDITPAISALENALRDKNARYHAAGALTRHSINKGEWKKIEELLKHENDIVRESVSLDIQLYAEVSPDMTHLVPALGNALGDKNAWVRRRVARALAYHYINEEEWEKIEELLGSEDGTVRYSTVKGLSSAAEEHDIIPVSSALVNALGDKNDDVRLYARAALEESAKTCDSIKKLNEIQKAFENYYREWMKKQPQGPSEEKIKKQIKTSELIMFISKRKAELSKEKGELFLGETVKKPKKDGKKIYREIRKVNRNG